MRAPLENPRICLACGCGRRIRPRPGRGRKRCYHAACRRVVQQRRVAKCRKDRARRGVLREQRAGHAYLFRSGLTRRKALQALKNFSAVGHLVPTIRRKPVLCSPADDYEPIRHKLHHLKSLLVTGTAPLSALYAATLALQVTLHGTKDVHVHAFSLWVGCEELLLEIGEPGASLAAVRKLHTRATAIEQFYAARRDAFGLARTLLRHAKIYREEHTLTQRTSALQRAIQATDHAYQFWTGSCDQRNAEVRLLRHRAVAQKLKLITYDAETPDRAAPTYKLLRALTQEISDERMVLVTLREEAGYFREIGNLTQAERSLGAIEEMTARFPLQTPSFRLGLLRPQINFFLHPEIGNKRAAREKVEEYDDLWRRKPTAYERQQLQAWDERHGLRSSWREVPTPVYLSTLLPMAAGPPRSIFRMNGHDD